MMLIASESGSNVVHVAGRPRTASGRDRMGGPTLKALIGGALGQAVQTLVELSVRSEAN
jgi:hypothetical protein